MNTNCCQKPFIYRENFVYFRFDLGNSWPNMGLILNDVGCYMDYPKNVKSMTLHRLFIWFDPWINADFQIRGALISVPVISFGVCER